MSSSADPILPIAISISGTEADDITRGRRVYQARTGAADPKKVAWLVGILVVLLFASFRQIPPAHIGLVVLFGSVENDILKSGLHLVNPLADIVTFNTKTQVRERLRLRLPRLPITALALSSSFSTARTSSRRKRA